MQWKKAAALVLAVCVLTQAAPFGALAEGEPLPGGEGQDCLCHALCTQEERNGDCPVCGEPGAELSLCQGQPAPEGEQPPEEPTPTPAGNEQPPEEPTPTPAGNEQTPEEPTPTPAGNEQPPEEPTPTPVGEGENDLPDVSLFSGPQSRAGMTREVSYLDGDGVEQTQTATLLDGSETELTEGWYLAEGEVEFAQRPAVAGEVHLILADGCSLSAPQGITVTDEDDNVENGSPNSLTIYGQQEGTGALTATAAADTGNAGIGGLDGRDNIAHGGVISIHGGVITAAGGSSSGSSGAGIGGAGGGKGGSVIITGGLVSATGGGAEYTTAAGVGGGGHADGGRVTVTGGRLTATGNTVGIGGGTFGGSLQGSGSFSLSGSGVVFATLIQDKSGESSWQGLVFTGGEGFVYGDSLTLPRSLTVPQGSTLYIPQGSTLTAPGLVNEGVLFNLGALNADQLENTGKFYSIQELAGATPISLQSAQYLDENGQTQTRADLIPLSGDMNSWTEGWYLVTGEVAFTQRVQIKGEVHLILADGCSLTAQRGINLLEGNSLTIYGQQEGTGALTATGYKEGESGIGGRYNENNSGAFTLNGGVVTAQGAGYAAGVGGGGTNTGGGTITLNGGRLSAKSVSAASAIGGGAWGGVGLEVVFNGGYVEVTGNIGAGYDNSDNGSFTTGQDCDGVLIVSGSIGDTTRQTDWKGVIFQNNAGKVYGGSVTVGFDWAVPSGATLTIDPGQSLTLGQGTSFANGGTIRNEGILDASGALITANGTVSGSGDFIKGSQADPAEGEGYVIDYGSETLNASSGFEAAASSAASAGSASLPLAPGSSPYTVWVRRAENALANASGWTAVTIPARPAAPALPEIREKTSDSIYMNFFTNPGQEYSLDGSDWEPYGFFRGLEPGRTYTIQARTRATSASFSSLPASRQVTTLNGDGSGSVLPGETAWITGKGPIQNDGSTVVIDGSVTLTPAPSGGAVFDADGEVSLPAGTQVTVGSSTPVTVSGSGATVGFDGQVALPGSSSATVGAGEGTVTITPPAGGITLTPGSDVTLPEGTVVEIGGTQVTVKGDNATLTPGGQLQLPEGSSLTVGAGEGAVTITPPAGGGAFTPSPEGGLGLPEGTVAENGGTQITVNGEGSALTPEGGIRLPEGGSATVDTGKGTVTVTPPAGGGTIVPGSDGSLGLPGGSALQDGKTTITLPEQGGLLKPDGAVSYSVTLSFDSQGGSQVAGQTLEVGSLAKAPAAPTRSGYNFTGWYRDAACTQLWDFAAMPVMANFTLYAGWQPAGQGGSDSSDSGSDDTPAPALAAAGSAPATGDPARLGLWLALGLSGLAIGVGATLAERKARRQ